jgi:3-hydroxy-9,10-secoandrosta-1,3,5(10)-triene-9,17-dione monooxygenase
MMSPSQDSPPLPPMLAVEPTDESDWLNPAEVATLTSQVLVERIVALKPLISANASEAERGRRLVRSVWRAILRTGALYHYVPRRFGGLELGMEEYVEETLPIAEVCASTCWVTGVTMGHNWLACHFPEPAQQEFFKNGHYIVAPAVGNPPGRAVRTPKGYKVSGRWRFGSGVMNSDWVIALVMIEGDTAPHLYWIAFPTSQAQVLDTWHVDGLAGTGSHDIVAKEVFVPEYMIVAMRDMENGASPGSKLHDNPSYRIPLVPWLNLSVTSTIVGAARGAVDIFRERLHTRKVFGTQTPLAHISSVQVRLARADLLVRTSVLLLRHVVRELHALAARGESDNTAARKAIVAQNAHTSTLAKEAVRLVTDASGASAHFLSDPLQRIVRDVNMATSHLAHDFETLAEQHGRSLLGIEASEASARIF